MTRSKRQKKKTSDVAHKADSRVVPLNPGSSKLKIRRYKYTPASVFGKFRKRYSEPPSSSTSLYVCHECNIAYQTAKSLAIHVSRYHKKIPGAKCPECPRMLSSKGAVAKHLLTHRPRSEWPAQCPLCFRRFQAINDVPKHFATYIHRGDPRIPEYQSKEWTELLRKCKVTPSSAIDPHISQARKASKTTNCTKRKSSVRTLSKNVPCVSNIQGSKPKATAEKNHIEQNDDSSRKKEKASAEGSQNFLEIKPQQRLTSSTKSGKPPSESVQNNHISNTFFHDHPYSVGPNLNITPETLNSDPKIVNPLDTQTQACASKRCPPEILQKQNPEATSSIATTQSASRTLSSYKVVKILGQNSTVIKQLLVPSNSQVYYVHKPRRDVFPTLSNAPVNSQKDFIKRIHPTLSNTPVEKQTFKLQFATQGFSLKPDNISVPNKVEKIAILSNEVIKPQDLHE